MTIHLEDMTGGALERLYYSREQHLFGLGHTYTDDRLVHDATVIRFGKIETRFDLDDVNRDLPDSYALRTPYSDTYTSMIVDMFDRVVVAGWGSVIDKAGGISSIGMVQLLTTDLHAIKVKGPDDDQEGKEVLFLEPDGFFNDVCQFGMEYWVAGGTGKGYGLIIRLDNNLNEISRHLVRTYTSGRSVIKKLYRHGTGSLALSHEVIDGKCISVLIYLDEGGKPVSCHPTNKFVDGLVNDLVIIPDEEIYLVGTGQAESENFAFIARIDAELKGLSNRLVVPSEIANEGVSVVFDEKRDLFHVGYVKREKGQSDKSIVSYVHRDCLSADYEGAVKSEFVELSEGVLLKDLVLTSSDMVIYGGRHVHENGVKPSIGSIGGTS